MAVLILQSKTNNSVIEAVAKEVQTNLAAGVSNVIVVPDGAVQTAKIQIMECVKTQCAFGLEVIGISALARRIASAKMLNEEQRLIIFKHVLTSCEGLKCFQSIVHNDGAAKALLSMIDTLIAGNISADRLANAAENIGGILGDKAQDIALLYRQFYGVINQKLIDKNIAFQQALNDIGNIAKPQNYFYFCGFSDMTAREADLLTAIAQAAKHVVIGVCNNQNSAASRIYPRFLTDFPAKMARKGVPVSVRDVADGSDEARRILLDNAFGFAACGRAVQDCPIEVRTATDICAEVKGVCREIRKMVVTGGFRYKDIVVFCPSVNDYYEDIKRQFEIFEIPYYVAAKKPLARFALPRLILDGLEALSSGYAKDKVLAFATNILLEIAPDDANAFQLFCGCYDVGGEKFLQPFDWATDSIAEKAESVRQVLLDTLAMLQEDSTAAIAQFVEHVTAGSRYKAYCRALQGAANGESVKAKLLQILQTIDEMSTFVGSGRVRQTFIELVKKCEICEGNRHVDNVFIAGNAAEIGEAQQLFIMAANDGVLVQEHKGIGLFCSNELQKLASQGVNFQPDVTSLNYDAKFEAVQLFAKAKKVKISYNQQLGEPSLLVKAVCDLLQLKPLPYIADANVVGMKTAEMAAKIGTKANAKQELYQYYSERLAGIANGDEAVFDYLYTYLGDDFKYQNIIKQKNYEYVSPNTLAWRCTSGKTFASISAIERYFDCPFKFFCEKTLGLKPKQHAGLDAMTSGSFIHRVLEKFFKRYKPKDVSFEQLAEICTALCEETLQEEQYDIVRMTCSAETLQHTLFKKAQYVLDKLLVIAERSDFAVHKTELNFGFEHSSIPPYELSQGGKKYYIRGKIDRIDKFDDYVAVIDYKTSKSVKYGLKQIYYGERLQLLIYLNAYMAKAKVQPFALLYMPLPHSYVKEDEKSCYKYVGLVGNLDNVIKHFDNAAEDKGVSSLPISYNKAGELSGANVLSRQEFDILREYADKVVAQAISEIEQGYIAAKPTGCDTCKFGQICFSKDNDANKREKKANIVFYACEDEENGD